MTWMMMTLTTMMRLERPALTTATDTQQTLVTTLRREKL